MSNIFKLVCGIVLLVFSQNYLVNAQNTDLKWGLSSQIKIRGISHTNGLEDIYSNNVMPVTLGGFAHLNKIDAKLELSTSSISLDVEYFFLEKMFFTLKGNWDAHNYEFDNLGANYSFSTIDDVNVFNYLGGVGYRHTFLGRLQCQGSILGGVVQSSKESGSSMINSGYGSNLRAKKTDTYQLKPSFVYGGVLELEWIPNPAKSRMHHVAPFIYASIVGANGSRTYRKVSVDEWVQGNVVYIEENRPSDRLYDLISLDFRFGIKLYFKK